MYFKSLLPFFIRPGGAFALMCLLFMFALRKRTKPWHQADAKLHRPLSWLSVLMKIYGNVLDKRVRKNYTP